MLHTQQDNAETEKQEREGERYILRETKRWNSNRCTAWYSTLPGGTWHTAVHPGIRGKAV
jgi:hypothetical protein